MDRKRIAVIGAGVAGLCVARHLKTEDVLFNVFEKASGVGGVWKYTDQTDVDSFGLKIHSAMYRDLKTNLPKQTIEFPDFPFEKHIPTFMSHSGFLNYLESYSKHFQIHPHIKFESNVEDVAPCNEVNKPEKWLVKYLNLKQNEKCSELYDAVFVCNGHYAVPNLPDLQNESCFKGSILHSHRYRKNDDYTNKNVVILGGRASGIDIGLDIAKVANHVRVGHRNKQMNKPLPDNMSHCGIIARFNENGRTVEFVDGSCFDADAVVYCTGYKYAFPFLHKECDIEVSNNRITWLYNHIINAKHPTMALIGVCARNAPIPQFHCQAQYAIAAVLGKIKLPTEDKMIDEITNDYEARLDRGMPHSYAHIMEDLQWTYNDMLADLAGVERIPIQVRELYWYARTRRRNFLQTYKEENFVLVNGKYEIPKDSGDDE